MGEKGNGETSSQLVQIMHMLKSQRHRGMDEAGANHKFYLRLLGSYKARAKKVWDKLVVDRSSNDNH